MSNRHVATAAVVKVSIGSPSGNSVAQFVRRGDILPEGVDKEQIKRLTKQGFIAVLEEPDPEPEPTVFSQADVDAAVKAATDAQAAELKQAQADLDAAKAEIEKKNAPAAKAPAAKQP
ncbi:hypothetical protein HF576_01905 [Microbacterium sp. CFH 90308]|uniref:Mu-like prophage FluMu N-terminal domain-containing protein n=1 Tax=Microbacterium salsuginis TaxID=2722803 RepID=A0ABX1K8B3_9MICO|nr:hypothetical protein [Microbacterium sp. CFH 90308]NLP82593.1 hypothetical protein [Microbacterium sp. CFH 90308]